MKPKTALSIKNLVLKTLEEHKANDTIALDVKKLTDLTDYMVITSGTSTRHVKSLADHVIEAIKAAKLRPISMEGEQDSTWILLDLGDVLVHIMVPETRDFYGLEKLWGLEVTQKARTSRKTKPKEKPSQID